MMNLGSSILPRSVGFCEATCLYSESRSFRKSCSSSPLFFRNVFKSSSNVETDRNGKASASSRTSSGITLSHPLNPVCFCSWMLRRLGVGFTRLAPGIIGLISGVVV